jgi:hypothetical protein
MVTYIQQDALSVIRDALISGRVAQLQLFAALRNQNENFFPLDGSLKSIKRVCDYFSMLGYIDILGGF